MCTLHSTAADGLITPAAAYQSDTDVPVPPSTTVNYNPHPAHAGGKVAPSRDSNKPHPHAPHVLSWLLSSHIALAGPLPQLLPRGTPLDNLTFIQETEQKLPFSFSLLGKLLLRSPFIPCSGSLLLHPWVTTFFFFLILLFTRLRLLQLQLRRNLA